MNVDAIYVISLSTSTDRQNLMKSWYPPEANLQFFITEKMKNPEQGCFESHQKVLEIAKSKGYNRVLILEDDAFPKYPWKEIVSKTNEALEELSDKKWEILALGYIPFRTKKTKLKNLLENKYTVGCHAYIVNVRNLKLEKYNKIAIDSLYFWNIYKPSYIKSYHTRDILIDQKYNNSSINFSSTNFVSNILPKLYGNIENMRDVSTVCNTFLLPVFIIIIFILLIINICIWAKTNKKTASWCSGISTTILIILLLILFLL